jgi:Domain of unknown function (DUF3846)
MQGKMFIIRENGDITMRHLTKPPELRELQMGVSSPVANDGGIGFIEAIPNFDMYDGQRCRAFCNEEGKLNCLPLNVAATSAWCQSVGSAVGDVLVGPIVILIGDEEFMEAL